MSLILKYDLGNPHRLPVGYTPLAYVSMPGNTYINTGLTGNQDTRVYLSYVSRGTGTSGSGVFGGRISAAENTLAIYTAWSSNTFCSWGNTYTGLGGTFDLTKRYNIYINKNSWKVNDSSEHTFSSATFTTPVMFVGGVNSNGSTHASDVDFYKCIIWQNQTLVMDLIPAKRNSDGVIGMFDIVSQTFKTNAGTGAFIAGPEVVALPYEYLLVEYLESSGVEYIDTGYLGKNLTKKEMDLAWLSNSGEQINGMQNGLQIAIRDSGKWCLCSVNSSTTVTLNKFYKASVRIESSKHILNVDGTDIHNITLPTTGDSNETIGCWNNNTGSSRTYWAKEKVRYVKFWNGTTLVRNMISCYRRSDLKPGMYDTVNNVFYTNAGSGEFILGPVVEESSRLLEYNNAGSNYIGKPTNVHHSTSNPSTTQINEGSGHFERSEKSNILIPALGISGDANFSISAWVKTANIVSDYVGVVAPASYSTSTCYSMLLYNNKISLDFYSSRFISTNAISNNAWHHIVVTKSSGALSASTCKIYIDGVSVAGTVEGLSSAAPNITNTSVYIGRLNDMTNRYFNGDIYDVRVYNNVLTADEVLQIYKGGL